MIERHKCVSFQDDSSKDKSQYGTMQPSIIFTKV